MEVNMADKMRRSSSGGECSPWLPARPFALQPAARMDMVERNRPRIVRYRITK